MSSTPNTPSTPLSSPAPETADGSWWLTRAVDRLSRLTNSRKTAYAIAGAALISGASTVATMLEADHDLQTVAYLLYIDLVLLLLMAVLVLSRFLGVWLERKRSNAGASLHIRLVMLFSLIAVTPAVLVAIFAAVFLNMGLQAWFSERVRTAVEDSGQVAAAYLYEHQQNIRSEAFSIANDLNRQAGRLSANRQAFDRFLDAQTQIRGIHEALVADREGGVIAHSQLSQALAFDLAPNWAFEKADSGEIVVLTSDQDDRVRAVMRLNQFVGAYLLIGRFVDARVIDHVERVEKGIAQYQRIEQQRSGLQVTFVMIFVVVALLLLLAAAWVGLTVATNVATPVSRLISAAADIGKGDLGVVVPERTNLAELDTLMHAFNAMTRQLASQKERLLDANRELDERRKFTETVLSGVSAGVIGLDANANINLPNRSASNLLKIPLSQSIGRPLSDVVPEMADLIASAIKRPRRQLENELQIEREGEILSFLVRVSAEQLETGEVIGYVVTFDDITALQSAQRQAAWADVARRIAHEIKNPLTPIQLSAERLKRKYGEEIESDPQTFETCTDTIVRQVGDIRRMVDEFSSFARMPEPSFRMEPLAEICSEVVFLEQNRTENIDVIFEEPERELMFRCDRRQISRALSNTVKNAIEAIHEKNRDTPGNDDFKGRVEVALSATEQDVVLVVEDNGGGLPKQERNRLTEPYITTREEGTGLGLAIVKKIVEEHNGKLVLGNSAYEGAKVSMIFMHETDAAHG